MVPGAEGLTLIPFIPLVLIGVSLLGLALLLLVAAGWATIGGKRYAGSLGRAAMWAGGVGALPLIAFVVVVLKTRAGMEPPSSPPPRRVTLAASFDLRTARSFEDLGLQGWAEVRGDAQAEPSGQRINLAGDITVHAVLNDRLTYDGKLSSLKAKTLAEGERPPLESLQLITAPLPWEQCATLAGRLKELSAEEQSELARWRAKQSGELWLFHIAAQPHQIAVHLPNASLMATTCAVSIDVTW
jgi:hypothetical protein